MAIKIAKEYRWEMGHRLPDHAGLCRNVHGHSYMMRVELEGEPGPDSMIMDYYDLDSIMQPIISEYDHGYLCDSADELMIAFLKANDFKYVSMDGSSTAENITILMLRRLAAEFSAYPNISRLTVRLHETDEVYAEAYLELGG